MVGDMCNLNLVLQLRKLRFSSKLCMPCWKREYALDVPVAGVMAYCDDVVQGIRVHRRIVNCTHQGINAAQINGLSSRLIFS